MPSPAPAVFRIEVVVRPEFSDSRGNSALAELRGLGLTGLAKVRSVRGYALALTGGKAAAERIAREALADAVVDQATVLEGDERPQLPAGFAHRIDIVKRKGVMDPAADGVLRAIAALREEVRGVRTYTAFLVGGTVSADKLHDAASKTLGNAAIEDLTLDRPHAIDPTTSGHVEAFTKVDVPLPQDDAALLEVSKNGGLSLSLVEMQTIRKHYAELGRAPTDVELETIAQTWSEHCKHKTLAGAVDCDGRRYDNLLKETIFKATRDLARPWCISVFKDNAGVIAFDDDHHVTFKVETHNHPSAIEPYGGAGTGIGGVLRDTMGTGLGAKPIVSTDVFCFGPPDLPQSEVPPGALHPRRVLKGVVAGVRDYGNRMGIPTANGAIAFDKRFIGNPLVFCGSVGILPANKVEKASRPGDRIVVVGGRTGRDGIHGATFSSRELHHESESLDSGAVQIGNAIQEKKVLDAQLIARDLGLYTCVTDCGAGGLSSAIGEMAEGLGADVELDRVPLKYAGLSYAEIWISEAQERMVLAVAPEHEAKLLATFAAEDVEATVIGTFTNSGRLVLSYRGTRVGDMDLEFLHHGVPRVVRKATVKSGGEPEPTIECPSDLAPTLTRLLAQPDIASKEWVVHQYDHEVQAGSIIKPFTGPDQKTPADAAVVRPKLDSYRGVAIGNGLAIRAGDIDPYAMGLLAIDEAIRNVLAVGARFDECALLDNFCSASCERPEVLGAVVRVAEACRDAALAWKTPFISGKDSLNNEFRTPSGTVQIPTTILISSIALMVDVRHALSSDFKRAGTKIVLLGLTRPELGGSQYYALHGRLGRSVPRVDLARAKTVFGALAKLTSERLLRSCHDLSDGGLGVALAEMAFSRGLGASIDLSKVVAADGDENAPPIERDDVLLFSESPTRFLLEVEPDKIRDVHRIIEDVPHSILGEVTATGRIAVKGLDGALVVDADIQALWRAFHGALDFGSPAEATDAKTKGALMKPKILVLRAAGTNCDVETAFAFERYGGVAKAIHVNELVAKRTTLNDFDGIALPGGFSYGDDIAAGKVLAIELLAHLKEQILALVDRGGIVLGICNGFQTLAKMGLLPGISARIGVQDVTLADNDSCRYEDRWVHIESVAQKSVFIKPGQRLHVPLAHGEGKYVAKDAATHKKIVDGGHVAFRYVTKDGAVATYPENPNGSIDGIAGLVDSTGRVMGLMPHPERAMFAVHSPSWTGAGAIAEADEGDGAAIFKNAVECLRG